MDRARRCVNSARAPSRRLHARPYAPDAPPKARVSQDRPAPSRAHPSAPEQDVLAMSHLNAPAPPARSASETASRRAPKARARLSHCRPTSPRALRASEHPEARTSVKQQAQNPRSRPARTPAQGARQQDPCASKRGSSVGLAERVPLGRRVQTCSFPATRTKLRAGLP